MRPGGGQPWRVNTVLRRLRAGDVADVSRMIFDAVHGGTKDVYDPAQRAAWMPRVPSGGVWVRRLVCVDSIVAVDGDRCVGVATRRPLDYLDLLYVDPHRVGAGLGRALVRRVMSDARRGGCRILTVDASLVAESVFREQGWRVVRRQVVRRRGVTLANVRMHVRLDWPAFYCRRSWGSSASRRSASLSES